MKYQVRHGRLVALPTLPVADCRGCGACCRHIGTPPGYAVFYPVRGDIPAWAQESPDYEHWRRLPRDVAAALEAYYHAVQAGTIPDRTRILERKTDAILSGRHGGGVAGDIPCLWYDPDTRRCRHYEHRPETCRTVIEPGDAACLAARAAYRIPLPEAPARIGDFRLKIAECRMPMGRAAAAILPICTLKSEL